MHAFVCHSNTLNFDSLITFELVNCAICFIEYICMHLIHTTDEYGSAAAAAAACCVESMATSVSAVFILKI